MLSAILCDLTGEPIRLLNQYSALEVSDILNDSRTARVTLSVFDPAAAEVRPLDRVLKVIYDDVLVFNGLILQCPCSFTSGTIDISAHDPTIKLKHHFHRYGDSVVDWGYPIDGRGMRMLIESSVPIEPQLDRDIPGNHILWGEDDSTHQGPRPSTNPPEEGDGIWRIAERGANVWETIVNVAQSIIGPDFRFRPVDTEHPGLSGTPPAGFMVEFDTYDRMETDRSGSVAFEDGFGQDNAEVVHDPDGDSVRNYFVQVYPGGERRRDDDERKALAHNEASWARYGIYEGWESSGQKDPKNVLQEKANAWVKAYSYPPDFVQVMPRMDREGVPRYSHDFFVGDLVTVRARKGYRSYAGVGRVISATVQQSDAAGNTQATLEVVPHIADDPAEGGDEIDDAVGGGD